MKRPLSRRAAVAVLKVLASLVVVFGTIDGLIRLGYFVRDSIVDVVPLAYEPAADYGPTPPWQERRSLIADDDTLIWRGQSNFRRKYVDVFTPVRNHDELLAMRHAFFPKMPPGLEGGAQWEVSTNSEGFRDVEFPRTKPTRAFRILCLGDSWTFGSNVGQDQAYPQRLQALLHERYPQASFEVFNLGVMGYATYNGSKLLETRALDLHPDLVILSFAMNEWHMAGYHAPGPKPRTMWQSLRQTANGAWGAVGSHWELYQLLRYWSLRTKWRPKPLGRQFEELSEDDRWYKTTDWNRPDLAWARRGIEEYEQYHRSMVRDLKRRGIGALLVYNEFWRESPLRERLERVAASERVPYVDSSALLAGAIQRIQTQLEETLQLRALDEPAGAAGDQAEVVFRVHAGKHAVPRALSITGPSPSLGNFSPNTLAMYDDGTHGDQKAGDHVWSYTVAAPPESTILYAFTNSGTTGKWEGLDIPGLRRFDVAATGGGRRIYTPIDTFGELYMHGDLWHTNANGNEAIARAVLDQLTGEEHVRRYLGSGRN